MAPLVAWLIVVLTVALAAVFGRQQVRTLRSLPDRAELSPEDRAYFRHQAWRRLAGCVLLVAIAAMMTGWYVNGLDAGIDALGAARDARRAAGGDQRFTPEQDSARRFYVAYVSGMLLLLLTLLLVTAVDVFAIRRYAARHSRAIRDGRRAMLENELAALRRERRRQRGDPSDN